MNASVLALFQTNYFIYYSAALLPVVAICLTNLDLKYKKYFSLEKIIQNNHEVITLLKS